MTRENPVPAANGDRPDTPVTPGVGARSRAVATCRWARVDPHPTAPASPDAARALPRRGTTARLEALARLRSLHSAAPLGLDKAARLASFVAGSRYAAVHLFDDTRQHRVAAAGGVPLVAVPAEDSMCVQVVASGCRITTPDATAEPRFAGNPFTGGPQPVRFYSSTPLRDDDGEVLGTLCVFDVDRIDLAPERLELLEDVAEQVRQHLTLHGLVEDLTHTAMHDPLTGLANRALLSERLTRTRPRGSAHLTRAVALVDLDGFKQVNDTLGHAAGDAVLLEAARRLSRVVRAEDTVARLGGDEFVVLYEDLEPEQLPALLPVLRTRLTEALTGTYQLDDGSVQVGASVGLVAAQEGELAYALLGRADQEMYADKAARKAVR